MEAQTTIAPLQSHSRSSAPTWLLLDPDVDGQNASNIVGNLSLIVSEEYSLILKEIFSISRGPSTGKSVF